MTNTNNMNIKSRKNRPLYFVIEDRGCGVQYNAGYFTSRKGAEAYATECRGERKVNRKGIPFTYEVVDAWTWIPRR